MSISLRWIGGGLLSLPGVVLVSARAASQNLPRSGWVTVGSTIAKPVALGVPKRAETVKCPGKTLDRYLSRLNDYVDQRDIAQHTPRISLAPEIRELRRISNDLEQMSNSEKATCVKLIQIWVHSAIEFEITGFTSFMGGSGETDPLTAKLTAITAGPMWKHAVEQLKAARPGAPIISRLEPPEPFVDGKDVGVKDSFRATVYDDVKAVEGCSFLGDVDLSVLCPSSESEPRPCLAYRATRAGGNRVVAGPNNTGQIYKCATP